MMPQVGMQPQMPQQSGSSVNDLMQKFRMLSPQEQQILDQAITPQIGEIMIKLFGEELRPMLQPLMQEQPMQPTTALNNVRA